VPDSDRLPLLQGIGFLLERQLTWAHHLPVNGKALVSCETIYIGKTSCRGGTLGNLPESRI